MFSEARSMRNSNFVLQTFAARRCISPNLAAAAVKEMRIQHLHTERLFRTVTLFLCHCLHTNKLWPR